MPPAVALHAADDAICHVSLLESLGNRAAFAFSMHGPPSAPALGSLRLLTVALGTEKADLPTLCSQQNS